MVDVKIISVLVVAALYVFAKSRIRAQSTVGYAAECDSCSQLEEELEFHATENMRQQNELESKTQGIRILENVSYAQTKEIQHLKLELQSVRRRLNTRSVTATYIGRLHQGRFCRGITKIDNKIYLLYTHPYKVTVFDDMINFRFMTDIVLNGINGTCFMVYNNESKCVYINDYQEKCIWVMTTTGEHRLTKWMANVTSPYTLSLSNEGHLLVLRQNQLHSQDSLDFYSLNATLIRRLYLRREIKEPEDVVQTSTGNFIIVHRLNDTMYRPWVISQLTNDGHLINRFIPNGPSQIPHSPIRLSLDSDNERLFISDYGKDRVILFDSSDLTWIKVLVSKDTNGLLKPLNLFFDASKNYLIVAPQSESVTVYEIN